MSDKSQNVIKQLEKNLDTIYKEHMARISEETEKKIQKLEELKKDSQNRFESYYNRKKIIDYLVYINLAVTPILFLIIIYIQFFKK